MPTYDYQCRSCGTVLEVIHSMLESGPTTCERCGGELRRVLYPAGIIFKGSGFYRTDSRNATSASTSAASKGADAAPSSSAGDGSGPASPGGDGGSSGVPASPSTGSEGGS